MASAERERVPTAPIPVEAVEVIKPIHSVGKASASTAMARFL